MTKKETVKCKNCGANEFVQEAGTTRCLYCQTEYISYPIHKSRKMIWLSLFILTLSLLIVMVFILKNTNLKTYKVEEKATAVNMSTKEVKLSKEKEYAEKNASTIEGLSLEKYDNIQIAALHRSPDKKEQYYAHGTLMKELIKELGPPEELVEYTQYYPGGAAVEGKANWSSGETLSDGSVGLYVIYDKDSDQILHKNLSASMYGLE